MPKRTRAMLIRLGLIVEERNGVMREITRVISWVFLVGVAVVLFNAKTQADDEDGSKPKHTIKEVMKAHKGKDSLLAKVKSGNASSEEKQQLLDLYISLYENDAPEGDAGAWKRASGTALMAAAKVVAGREGSVEMLTKATNCAACHKAHKPK